MSTPEYMKGAAQGGQAAHDDRHARRATVLTMVNIALTGALGVMMVALLAPRMAPEPAGGGWPAAQQKELAVKLNTEGLSDRAVEAFETYLRQYTVDSGEVARVSYLMGKIRCDQQRYEDAMACFHRAQIAEPGGQAASDAGRQMVTCLDRLGRSYDARYALDQQTALRASARTQDVRSAVVAKIGDEQITLRDVENELQKLPAAQQAEAEKPEGKLDFLKQHITQKLLFKKGLVLGVDRQADVRERVAAIERQLVVRQLLDDEIKKRVTIESGDVKLFYEANPGMFMTPARARATVVVCTNRAEAEAVLKAALEAGTNDAPFATAAAEAKKRKQWFEGQATADGRVAGMGLERELADAVLAQKAGLVSNVLPVSAGFAVARAAGYVPGAVRPFAEAQADAERLYRARKEQQALQDMIEETMKANRVQLYPERLSPSDADTGGGGR